MTLRGQERKAGDRSRVRRQTARLLALVALVDLLVLSAAVLMVWDLRLKLDIWARGADPAQQLGLTVVP
jgi:hypothetical protein